MDSGKGEKAHRRTEKSHWLDGPGKAWWLQSEGEGMAGGSNLEVHPG